jgi:hypothetical protein
MSKTCYNHKLDTASGVLWYPWTTVDCPYCRIAELEQQLAVLTSVKTKGESTLFNEICAANRKLNNIKVLAELCNQLEELQDQNSKLVEALREVANIIEPDQPHDELLIDAVRIAAAALKEATKNES